MSCGPTCQMLCWRGSWCGNVCWEPCYLPCGIPMWWPCHPCGCWFCGLYCFYPAEDLFNVTYTKPGAKEYMGREVEYISDPKVRDVM